MRLIDAPKDRWLLRFYLIDGLRGLAATWVVLFHAYMGAHLDGLATAIPPVIVD